MAEDRILISIDLSMASELLVELLLEDALDATVFGEVARANMTRPEVLRILLEHPNTPEDVREFVLQALQVPVERKTELARVRKPADEKTQEERMETILQKIQRLKVSEKILLAMRGGKEIRGFLIRDTNKEVALMVLENPKITETEVEIVSRSRSSHEEVLRRISRKREWMKNYAIIHALVTNPKTPPSIGLTLVPHLKLKDLVLLEKNKNVSEGIRSMSKKLARAKRGI